MERCENKLMLIIFLFGTVLKYNSGSLNVAGGENDPVGAKFNYVY